MMLPEILSDGFFAAVAAIGFGAISDPPMRAFPVIALLAAVGHALRFVLMAGAAAPIFLFNKRAQSLTRDKKHLSEQ